jgi:Spy/CpxP family protein refolding chaperone
MNRRLSFALSFALVMLIPAFLFAQMGGMKGECGQGLMGLGLDDEQQMKMEKLSLEHRLATIDLKAEQMKLRLQMKEELLKDEPDKKALEKFAKSIAANHEKMQMSRIGHMLDVKKILTAEQWKMFVEKHYAKRGMRGGHRCMDREGKRSERGCCERMRSGMKGDHSCRMERPRDGSCREMNQPAKKVEE